MDLNNSPVGPTEPPIKFLFLFLLKLIAFLARDAASKLILLTLFSQSWSLSLDEFAPKELVRIISAPAFINSWCKLTTLSGLIKFHNSGGSPVSSPLEK